MDSMVDSLDSNTCNIYVLTQPGKILTMDLQSTIVEEERGESHEESRLKKRKMDEDFQHEIEHCRTSGQSHEAIAETQNDERRILEISPGSVFISVECPSEKSATNLKHLVDSGDLAKKYEKLLVTDELKKKYGLKNVNISLSINALEFDLCLKELAEDEGEFVRRKIKQKE